jgi:hypothetical protein
VSSSSLVVASHYAGVAASASDQMAGIPSLHRRRDGHRPRLIAECPLGIGPKSTANHATRSKLASVPGVAPRR